MAKSLRILLSFFLAATFFFSTACSRKQQPTQYSDGGGASPLGAYDGDLIPATDLGGEWGPGAGGLEMRGDGMSDGFYNGRRMQEGILPSVYFGFDSASVSASERAKVQQAADYLMDNPDTGILIEGHCDWYGTSEYNLALGDRRATSVADYLATLGVNRGRIETLSKGSLEATSGLSKAQASEDRRADLIVLE